MIFKWSIVNISNKEYYLNKETQDDITPIEEITTNSEDNKEKEIHNDNDSVSIDLSESRAPIARKIKVKVISI